MPDTTSSGSYAVSAYIEPQYKPEAFKPEFIPDTNITLPVVNETKVVAPEKKPVEPPPVETKKNET